MVVLAVACDSSIPSGPKSGQLEPSKPIGEVARLVDLLIELGLSVLEEGGDALLVGL